MRMQLYELKKIIISFDDNHKIDLSLIIHDSPSLQYFIKEIASIPLMPRIFSYCVQTLLSVIGISGNANDLIQKLITFKKFEFVSPQELESAFYGQISVLYKNCFSQKMYEHHGDYTIGCGSCKYPHNISENDSDDE